MENLILFVLGALFLYLVSKSEESGMRTEIEDKDEVLPGHRFDKQEEEMFYHPTTGYKGTRSEMDAYIINREKELRR